MLPRSLFLLPRLYLSIIFLVAVSAKLTSTGGFAPRMIGFLNATALQSAAPWYQAFVRTVVLTHASLFAGLVIAGELVVGITLLVGLATRAGAAVAIVLLFNYFSAKGLPPWSPASNDIADIVLCILVVMSAAGRYFGIDQILAQRFPRAVIW